jgi:hypothetical protein
MVSKVGLGLAMAPMLYLVSQLIIYRFKVSLPMASDDDGEHDKRVNGVDVGMWRVVLIVDVVGGRTKLTEEAK